MSRNLRYASHYAYLAQINRERMRRTGFTPVGDRLWTKPEDELVRLHYPDYAAMRKALPLRSHGAIRMRVQTLGVGRKNKRWTTRDHANMRKHYPNSSWKELREIFPGRTRIEIRAFAYEHRIIRRRRILPSGFPLIDAVLRRAMELNMSLGDLDKVARTRGYFQARRWTGKNAPDGRYVLRVIAALDGEVSDIRWKEY